MHLSPNEARVLGVLLEKAGTTPEHYPLSTQALITACNQSSNREPITDLTEAAVLDALRSLRDAGLARSVKRPGDRVMKHHHDLDRALGLDAAEQALVAVLLLRGPQTPGELRARTERYGALASIQDVEAALARLAARDEPLVVRSERRPGQKEARWSSLLIEDRPGLRPGAAPDPAPDRLAALEHAVASLQQEVSELRDLLS